MISCVERHWIEQLDWLGVDGYDCMQRRGATPGGRRASENAKAGSLQHFLCGLIAGTIAKLGTHPLDVCKKRFQARPWCRCCSQCWLLEVSHQRSAWQWQSW